MPSNSTRSAAVLYDQFEDDQRFADWGADELFTRMPRPRLAEDTRRPAAPATVTQAEPAHRRDQQRQRATDSRRFVAEPRARPDRTRRTAAPRRVAAEPTRRVAASRPGAAEPTRHVAASRPGRVEPAGAAVRPRRPLELVQPPADHRATAPSGPPTGPIELSAADRPTKLMTGLPTAMPRALPIVPAPRPRRTRSVAEWIAPRPERLVAWAFVLGILLVMVAISTADAATA